MLTATEDQWERMQTSITSHAANYGVWSDKRLKNDLKHLPCENTGGTNKRMRHGLNKQAN